MTEHVQIEMVGFPEVGVGWVIKIEMAGQPTRFYEVVNAIHPDDLAEAAPPTFVCRVVDDPDDGRPFLEDPTNGTCTCEDP